MGKLSSDILEQQFGQTALRIHAQNEQERITTTSQADTGAVLEIAWVRFKTIDAYPSVHASVLSGISMGKAFQVQGVAFRRKTHIQARVAIPKSIERTFRNKEKATLVEVSIYIGAERIHYADITELYAPDVDWPPSKTSNNRTREHLKLLVTRLDSLKLP